MLCRIITAQLQPTNYVLQQIMQIVRLTRQDELDQIWYGLGISLLEKDPENPSSARFAKLTLGACVHKQPPARRGPVSIPIPIRSKSRIGYTQRVRDKT